MVLFGGILILSTTLSACAPKAVEKPASDQAADEVFEKLGVKPVDAENEKSVDADTKRPCGEKRGKLLTEKELVAAFPQRMTSLEELVTLIDNELKPYPVEKIDEFPRSVFLGHKQLFEKAGIKDFGLFGSDYLFIMSDQADDCSTELNGYAFSTRYDSEPDGQTFRPENGTLTMRRKRIEGKWYMFWDAATVQPAPGKETENENAK